MAGPGKRGRKRKEVLLQESLHGGSGGLLQMQLHAAFLPSPPPQDIAISPATHRYPTRSSNAVPNQCASSMVPLSYPLRNQMETPKQCYVTARRILLEANNVPHPANGEIPALEKCTSEIPHQDQVSNSPATSLSYSSPSARIDKSMKAWNSVSTKSANWSAPISKAGLDMGKFTDHLISQTERPEELHPLVPLIQFHGNLAEKNLPMTEANVVSNVYIELPERTAMICHTQKVGKLSRSSSFNLTEIAQTSNDAFLDDDEVESAIDPALVTVNEFRVKEEVAPLLRAIFAKHGDIAKDSILESSKARELFLEMVCGIYQKLEESRFVDITTFELNGLLRLIYDLERMKVDVKWLHQKIDEISHAKRLLGDYSGLKKEKTRNCELIARKEEELAVLQQKIFSANAELAAMKSKAEEIDKKVLDIKEKASGFCQKSLVHGLL